VQGLEGKGDLGAKRHISPRELASYVVDRVGDLAKGLKSQQEPQYFRRLATNDHMLVHW
jgi:hypothetical protein